MPNLFPESFNEGLAEIAETEEQINDEIGYGRSWKFDFEKGDFVTDALGKVVEADSVEAWIEWCRKAIHTERYKYLVYSDDHGQEFDELIRLDLTREANESEIKRMVTECLMVNPRTASVGNFEFEWDEDRVYFYFDITNTLDELVRINESVVMAA